MFFVFRLFHANISWRDHLCIASTSCWPTYCDSASKRAYQRNNLQLLSVHSVHITSHLGCHWRNVVCIHVIFFFEFSHVMRDVMTMYVNEWILCKMNGVWLPKQSVWYVKTCGTMTKSHTGTNTTVHRKQLNTYLAVQTTIPRQKHTQKKKEKKTTTEE